MIRSSGCSRSPLTDEISAIDVHVFSTLKLVAKDEVANLMRNGEPLPIWMIAVLHRNASAMIIRDQQPGHVWPKIVVYDLESQLSRNVLDVNRCGTRPELLR